MREAVENELHPPKIHQSCTCEFLVDSFENIVSCLEEGVARRLGKGHAWMSTNFGVGLSTDKQQQMW